MEYPQSRRILMQAVLLFIFGSSVALAAYVTHVRRGAQNTHLSGVRYVGQVGVRLPKGWILDRENLGSVLFLAREPESAQRKGRRIIIRSQKLTTVVSSEEYLQNSHLLDGTERLTDENSPGTTAESLTIAGEPGIELTVIRPTGGFLGFNPTAYEKVLFAASVRPSGRAVSLEMECPDETDATEDRIILSDIAAAMEVQDSKSGQ